MSPATINQQTDEEFNEETGEKCVSDDEKEVEEEKDDTDSLNLHLSSDSNDDLWDSSSRN